jgi:transcriptional regulator with XRE-family HTH domain
MKKLNEILKDNRKSKNLTLREMEKHIGISRTLLSAYEIGKQIPNTKTLHHICRFYGMRFLEMRELRNKAILTRRIAVLRRKQKREAERTEREIQRLIWEVEL